VFPARRPFSALDARRCRAFGSIDPPGSLAARRPRNDFPAWPLTKQIILSSIRSCAALADQPAYSSNAASDIPSSAKWPAGAFNAPASDREKRFRPQPCRRQMPDYVGLEP